MALIANKEQADLWGGDLGRRWLARQAELDALSQDVTDHLLARAALRPGHRVLEVGCGSGHLALALARAVGPDGEVLALDVSAALLARAEERRAEVGLGNLRFALEDAETATLPAQHFDLVISQFGVMFFADTVAAFANLRRALKPGGRFLFACFAAMEANPWLSLPRAVAVGVCGAPPPAPAGASGPTALASIDRTLTLLARAGFADPRGEERAMTFHHPGGPGAAADLACVLGPAAFVLRNKGAGEAERSAVRDGIRAALAAYATPDGVRVPVTVNIVTATAP